MNFGSVEEPGGKKVEAIYLPPKRGKPNKVEERNPQEPAELPLKVLSAIPLPKAVKSNHKKNTDDWLRDQVYACDDQRIQKEIDIGHWLIYTKKCLVKRGEFEEFKESLRWCSRRSEMYMLMASHAVLGSPEHAGDLPLTLDGKYELAGQPPEVVLKVYADMEYNPELPVARIKRLITRAVKGEPAEKAHQAEQDQKKQAQEEKKQAEERRAAKETETEQTDERPSSEWMENDKEFQDLRSAIQDLLRQTSDQMYEGTMNLETAQAAFAKVVEMYAREIELEQDMKRMEADRRRE